MARTTGTNSQVAHVWAQDTGALMRSGSMRTEDSILRSYAATIGRFITPPDNGPRVALVSSNRWSVTTAHHISLAKRATGWEHYYEVPNLDPGLTSYVRNSMYYTKEVTELLEKSIKARNFAQHHLDRAETLDGIAKEYCGRFIVDYVSPPEELWEKARAHLIKAQEREEYYHNETHEQREKRIGPARARREQLKRENERLRREQQIAYQAALLETHKELRAKWRAGEHVSYPYGLYGAPAELRMKPGTNDTVQTSQGAEFPLSDARIVFRYLVHHPDGLPESFGKVSSMKHNVSLGHFKVDSFDGTTIKAGCHTVTWEEAVRFMNSL